MTAALLLGMRLFVLLVVLSATAYAGPEASPPPPPAAPPPAAPAASKAEPTPTPVPVTLSKLDPNELPERCRDLATLSDSASKAQALSARISLASCLVDQRTKPLVLCDCEQSVIDVNAAIDPSLALLDEVVMLGDAASKILARHTQAEILSSFAQRMVATVPAAANASDEAIALRDTRLDLLQPHLQPWLARAQAAYAEVDKLARANPQLAKNPAVLAAVRATRTKLSTQAAKR